jgi:pimeloyl-ACP methyl ester carboxylesterase
MLNVRRENGSVGSPSMHKPIAFAVIAGLTTASFASAQSTSLILVRSDGGETPIRRYGPPDGCGPAMIVSHGFGGSERGNGVLATAMAARGWRVLVMGHRETGGSALRAALVSLGPRQAILDATTTPPNHKFRSMDLDAAVSDMTGACRPAPFVLAGHSMGAMTTMLEAGAKARFGRFGADRFDAYVAISPQGLGYTYEPGAWVGVTKPVLMITGTRDQGSDGGYETRLSAFEGLPPGRKRLAIIPKAGHLALSTDWNNEVARGVVAVVVEFLDGLRAGRSLPPSRLASIDVRDK